ncbi:protein QUIRKY isoform X2 [Prunus yedoensis var. nudiflora]|uniref:Protein QUIRKY isoform X2 n=1 Tax=Prunus yedoensis var. nudiflora TaxID=2094558 RepID=A0A314Y5G3_PRUYE|nr:protein QUIRKY isoform X2 [Prunus yedoensis var. nudiflora]
MEIPLRDLPNSPLAPQWYRLEGGGARFNGDLMLATWMGTQADDSFPDAWKTDTAKNPNARAKVYRSHVPGQSPTRIPIPQDRVYRHPKRRAVLEPKLDVRSRRAVQRTLNFYLREPATEGTGHLGRDCEFHSAPSNDAWMIAKWRRDG